MVSDDDLADVLSRLRPPRRGREAGFIASFVDVLDSAAVTQWLVLDDVHNLDSPSALAACEELIGVASDSTRLILVGRSDPTLATARLRVSGDLAELRAADLAFTVGESSLMLSRLGIELDPSETAQLHRRTEGWAAGLRLAALSLADAPDVKSTLALFAGDQRAVADYLFAEVLHALSSDLRDFLASTCAPERLDAALAQHLSGRADAGAVLEQLSRANALVTQLADPSMYSYHALLRSYLAVSVMRQDHAAFLRQHAAAAEWLRAHGRRREALLHAIEAGEPSLIIEVIEAVGLDLILSGASALLRRAIAAAPSQVIGTPSVRTIVALAALDVGDLATAETELSAIPAKPPEDMKWARLRGSALLQRALLGGDVVAALADTGMNAWHHSGDPAVDLMVLAYRGPARIRSAEYANAISDLEHALELAERGGYDESVLWILSQLSGASGAACDFAGMKAWSDRAIEYARPRGWADSPRLAYGYLLAAWTGFQTGEIDAQTRYAKRAARCLDPVANVEVDLAVRSMGALARFELSEGHARYQAAERFHRVWQTPVAAQASPALVGFATPQEVRLALTVGRRDWAATACARVAQLLPDSAESETLRATLMAHDRRVNDALAALRPVFRDEVIVHVRTTVVTAQLLGWRLCSQLGSSAQAHDLLTRAIDWAAPRNFRRPFLEMAAELRDGLAANLGRFGHADQFVDDLWHRINDQPAAPATVIGAHLALTTRELDVLRDLPSQLGAAQIAEYRQVSINTVKTHIASIYRKLGVPGRREAVLEGRRLGLI
jgi:LuxR family maltose regulon positive regulatory protein